MADLASLFHGLRLDLEAMVRRPGLVERLEPLGELFVDADGWTPLHHAAFTGDIAAIEAVLAGGLPAVIVNQEACDGYTPFMCALAGGAPKAAALLAQHGGTPPTPSQQALMFGGASKSWLDTPIEAFRRYSSTFHPTWFIQPLPDAKGISKEGTDGCHLNAWERVAPLYEKYLADGGTPLTNQEAACLSAVMEHRENRPIKDREDNVKGPLSDSALDKVLIEADKLGKMPQSCDWIVLEKALDRNMHSIEFLTKLELPGNAQKVLDFFIQGMLKVADPQDKPDTTKKPDPELMKVLPQAFYPPRPPSATTTACPNPHTYINSPLQEIMARVQNKLKQHSQSKGELSNEMARATIFCRGVEHTPSPGYVAMIHALVRDGWTTYAKEEKADKESWDSINRIEGRYIGGPVPGGLSGRATDGSVNTFMGVSYKSGSPGYNGVVESMIHMGGAGGCYAFSQADVNRAESVVQPWVAAGHPDTYAGYSAWRDDK